MGIPNSLLFDVLVVCIKPQVPNLRDALLDAIIDVVLDAILGVILGVCSPMQGALGPVPVHGPEVGDPCFNVT